MKQTNKLPILPEFLDKNIMLHVTPKCPTSMYVGMPIQKALKFELNLTKIKEICLIQSKGNIFQKMSLGSKILNTPSKDLNSSFSGIFWGKNSADKNKDNDNQTSTVYKEGELFSQRSSKFYQKMGQKIILFCSEMKKKYNEEFNISNQLDMILFLMKKWELSEELQVKVKTLDEEKNYLMNELKMVKKENKNLHSKNKQLLIENSSFKSKNELLAEEKNFFIKHKTCLDGLQSINEQNLSSNIQNNSGSLNFGKSKLNSSYEMISDKQKVNYNKKGFIGNQNTTLEITMIDQEMRNEIDFMEENNQLKDKIEYLERLLKNYKIDIEHFRKIYTQNKVDQMLSENKRLKVNK